MLELASKDKACVFRGDMITDCLQSVRQLLIARSLFHFLELSNLYKLPFNMLGR
jgi:hypothetical protein